MSEKKSSILFFHFFHKAHSDLKHKEPFGIVKALTAFFSVADNLHTSIDIFMFEISFLSRKHQFLFKVVDSAVLPSDEPTPASICAKV